MAAGVAAAVAVVVLAVVLGGGEEPDQPSAPALVDAVPFDGRSPREPAGAGTRVLVALPRPSLAAAGLEAPDDQRAYVGSLRDEAAALRSALAARGVELADVVTFERCFNGFAATVRTGELTDVASLGARVRPVRRFYPATAEPARVPGTAAPRAAVPLGGVAVAVLDTGVDATHPLLAGRLDPGHDAVDGDADPAAARDPRGGRRESSGTALAGVLAAAGERVQPIRVAGLQPAVQQAGVEEVALSDQLLAGLERAVDPDGDGATDDHASVALVGVNAPYAGFADTVEARAVGGAAALGTLVVAPAGHEGAPAGPQGTIGSPGAAPEALTVGALAAAGALPRLAMTIGEEVVGAALLAGAPPPARLQTAGPLRSDDPAELAGTGGRALRGRLAVVEAGNAAAARVAAAAAAGARAVLVAEPRPRRPLPAVPAGRAAVPVLGVTGAAARTVLAAQPGARIELGAATWPRAGAPAAGKRPDAGGGAGAGETATLSPSSSRGPAATGGAKPDLAAPAGALTAIPGGGGAVVGGTAIAAAHAAVEAAKLARARPDASPAELLAALTAGAGAAAAPPARGAGAGVLRAPAAGSDLTAATRPRRRSDPCPTADPCVRVVLANRSAGDVEVELRFLPDPGTEATVAPARLRVPAGGRREAEITARRGDRGAATGRLEARGNGRTLLLHPVAAVTAEPAPPPLGPLELRRRGARVTGVRFPLGAFDLGDPLTTGTRVELVARLDLALLAPGGGAERLTPRAGARELLPAEYAYTLPRAIARALGEGPHRFRARARSPLGGAPAEATSDVFRP